MIGIVVDQMRTEFLFRYSSLFSDNGFKRLLNDGFFYSNLHYNYVPTFTAPGHASIYTGTTPVNHGIVANEWFHRGLKRDVYCTEDFSVVSLGNPDKNKEGQMSPKNLQSSTITDELKLATNFKSKVYGVSMKDRGAILPAGHFADRAYWISDNGNFISSNFYGNEFPSWVTSFNESKRYMKYIQDGWKLFKDKSFYKDCLPDDNPYESTGLKIHKKAVFPYLLTEDFAQTGPKVIKSTPFTNDLIVEFAEELIENEKLGNGDVTDFLTLSFSATDIITHLTGPRSIETLDTYLRLDDLLGKFLTFLDKKVGKGNYLLFLTADHSGSENPKHLKDHGYDIASLNAKEMENKLRAYSIEKYEKDLILSYSNQNIYIDDTLISPSKKFNEIVKDFANFIESFPEVKRAYTEDEILNISAVDEHGSMIFRGYDKKQNGQIYVLLKPGYIEYKPQGATHGSSYTYDTHVPLIFYGWKTPHGTSSEKHYITEIAPTIAQKISITFPNSTNSQILSEVIKY